MELEEGFFDFSQSELLNDFSHIKTIVCHNSSLRHVLVQLRSSTSRFSSSQIYKGTHFLADFDRDTYNATSYYGIFTLPFFK